MKLISIFRKTLFLTGLSLILSLQLFAQNYSADVELLSQAGSDATFRTTAADPKASDAEEEAVISTFKVLFHDGVEGLKNDQPMMAADDASFEYSFFGQKRYLTYLSGKPVKVSDTKYGGMRKVTFDVPINLRALQRDLEGKGVALGHAWANQNKESQTSAINPSICVVPAVKGGGSFEDMRNLMETNPAVKQSVNELMALFSRKGFQTRDFQTALQNSSTDELLRDGSQSDMKTMVVQNLPGDIVVTVDVDVNEPRPKTFQCNLGVRAVERQTESLLASEAFTSGRYHVSDPAVLSEYALKQVNDSFFSQLTEAFNRMAKTGRQMALELQLADGVDWDFESEAPATGEFFMDELEEWLRAHSFQGNYDMGNTTDKFIRASLKLPLWDNEKNRSYKISNFTSQLRKFLNSQLGGEYKPQITSMGQRIIVTIQ